VDRLQQADIVAPRTVRLGSGFNLYLLGIAILILTSGVVGSIIVERREERRNSKL
jgi:hypothetical protein